ncbi:AAA family ATPase [Nocardia transvalensis]|nr:AAA family ATPase [Nocardia transvalensis]
MVKIKTRRPTGAVPWPLILLEGGEKTGKSWQLAQFSACDRIGQAYWIDLGEGSMDEYAAIPGANYLVVDHDGTWRDIYGQVSAIREEAKRANDAGDKPVVLFIDSMTAEWEMLKDWVGARARESNYAKKILAKDPDAEIKPAMNLWNDANDRHNRLMYLLMTFPGIVVMTARGKTVAAMDPTGKPIAGEREYRVEGHKNLAFDASAWVRLSRDEPRSQIIGARSVHAGVRPGADKPVSAPEFTLEWLIFTVLQCDPTKARVRALQPLDSTADSTALSDADIDTVVEKAKAAGTVEELHEIWTSVAHRLGRRKTEVSNVFTILLNDLRATDSESAPSLSEVAGSDGEDASGHESPSAKANAAA